MSGSPNFPKVSKPLVGYAIVAEDSQLLLKMIVDGLTKSNTAVKVDGVTSGEEMLTYYVRALKEGEQPDLVILDAGLPLLPGTSAAVAIRAIEESASIPPVPVIFLTMLPASVIQPTIDLIGKAVYLSKQSNETSESLTKRLIDSIHEVISK